MNWETDWLEGRCRINPDDVAVKDAETGEMWTFSRLNRRAVRLAQVLTARGIGKGDRVALLSPNHISYFDLLFACGKLGAIFVPLNWRLSVKELADILADCEPVLLAYHNELEEASSTLPVRNRLNVCDFEYERSLSEKGMRGDFVFPEVTQTDELAIIYTGGTTGKPKGVVLTHQAIHWNAVNTILSWNLSNDDVTLTYLPMFHTGGLNALTIPILLSGGKVVLARKFDPAEAIRLLNEELATIVLLVPTMHHLLVNHPDFSSAQFPSMKTFLSGGAPCPHRIYEAYHAKGIAFKEGYGLTEAGPNNFYIHPEEARRKHGSIGRPMMLNAVRIVDDYGCEVDDGQAGELLIQGHHVFRYYWRNEQATHETLRDGWLCTGDLAMRDGDGYHYILGRKKEMIITGGENVFPLEVEQWISEHPAVSEVSVVGLPDEKWGELVAAFVVVKQGHSVGEAEIKQHCAGHLGRYKIPKRVLFVEELPKTDVGKIDKKALVEEYV